MAPACCARACSSRITRTRSAEAASMLTRSCQAQDHAYPPQPNLPATLPYRQLPTAPGQSAQRSLPVRNPADHAAVSSRTSVTALRHMCPTPAEGKEAGAGPRPECHVSSANRFPAKPRRCQSASSRRSGSSPPPARWPLAHRLGRSRGGASGFAFRAKLPAAALELSDAPLFGG